MSGRVESLDEARRPDSQGPRAKVRGGLGFRVRVKTCCWVERFWGLMRQQRAGEMVGRVCLNHRIS